MTRERVVQVLFEVIGELNRQRPEDDRLEQSVATVLSGEGGQLDSLGLINFIIAVEQKVEDEFHTAVILTNDAVLATENGPLRTVDSLADYLVGQLKG